MSDPEHTIQSQEKLIGDLRQVIENAQELLKNTGQHTGLVYQQARARLNQALQSATTELAQFEQAQLVRMMDATRSANERHGDRTGEAKLMRAFN